MESSYRLAVERVTANAERIRRVELPAYEQLVNVRAKRYRLLADVYADLRRLRGADIAPAAPAGEYCAWRRLLDGVEPPGGSCDFCPTADHDDDKAPPLMPLDTANEGGLGRNSSTSSSSSMPEFDGCELPPVEPLIHHRSPSSVSSSSSSSSLS